MTNIAELRGKSPDELKDMAMTLKKELFNLRFQLASGEAVKQSRFKEARRDIARIKTMLGDPQQANAGSAPKAAKPAKAKKAAPAAAEPKAKKAPAKKKA